MEETLRRIQWKMMDGQDEFWDLVEQNKVRSIVCIIYILGFERWGWVGGWVVVWRVRYFLFGVRYSVFTIHSD